MVSFAPVDWCKIFIIHAALEVFFLKLKVVNMLLTKGGLSKAWLSGRDVHLKISIGIKGSRGQECNYH